LVTLRSLRDSSDKFEALSTTCVVQDDFQEDESPPPPVAPQLSSRDLDQVRADKNARVNQSGLGPESPSASTPTTFNSQRLPPQNVVQEGGKYFFCVIAGLFHVMTADEFSALCHRCYRSDADPDILDVAEMCAIASVGVQYHPAGASDALKDALFKTAVQHINDLTEASPLRAVRSLACLSGYGVIEKRRSTRSLIHLGLQLVRWNKIQRNNSNNDYVTWRNLYRTMAFFECWLSTSLGYSPDLSKDEIELVFSAIPAIGSIDDTTQIRVVQVGLMKAQTLTEVCTPQLVSVASIEYSMAKLENWRRTLPPYMQLGALMEGLEARSEGGELYSASHKGALFLAHAMYLGTIVILHQRVLVATADCRVTGKWSLKDVPPLKAQEYHARCVDAARASARIFILLGFNGETSEMHKRCWLCL